MNRRTNARSSSLFLIELIISILFFAVASSVCVQFFVKARLMSHEAAELTQAVSACTMASETIASGDSLASISERLNSVYPGCEADLTTLDQDKARTIQLSDELSAVCSLKEQMLSVTLHCTSSSGDALYDLAVDKYLPGGEP